MSDKVSMESIVNLCKRRGFVFPSAEIYGGLGGFWDWGPLGVLLKNNIKTEWRKTFVQKRDDVVSVDGTIITKNEVLIASGHANRFRDFLLECRTDNCKKRYKADDVLPKVIIDILNKKASELLQLMESGKDDADTSERKFTDFSKSLLPDIDKQVECPNCNKHNWIEPRYVEQMFKTAVGPLPSTAQLTFLRPETAQNIFVNFGIIRESMRLKLPFGIAQIGKAFRNEITPGNFVFRSREFEQMEIEYFVKPGDDDSQFESWVEACHEWFQSLGLSKDHIRLIKQPKEELAHYSKATTDIEFAFPIEKGWAELMGIANRTDFDLKQHGKFAKGDENAFATPVDDLGKEKKVPFVIEPSMGVDRAALAFMLDAYTVVEGGRSTTTESIKEEEVVLKLHPKLAPYKAAILPLSKKPELQKVAQEIATTLRKHWMIDYDETGSIGKRYRREDEIGTPWCITVDFDTIEGTKRPKDTVTIRDRDTMEQENVAIGDLVGWIQKKLE